MENNTHLCFYLKLYFLRNFTREIGLEIFMSCVTLAIYRKPGTVSQTQLTHFASQSSHGKKDPYRPFVCGNVIS